MNNRKLLLVLLATSINSNIVARFGIINTIKGHIGEVSRIAKIRDEEKDRSGNPSTIRNTVKRKLLEIIVQTLEELLSE